MLHNNVEIFMHLKKISRRELLKKSISSLPFLALPNFSFSQSSFDVVVIGAGASGLSATAELLSKGKSVLCVEAMNRIGGRCHTDNSIFGVPYDMGAHWLHNYSGNQIAEYGKNHRDEFNIYRDQDKALVCDGQKKVTGFKLYNLYKKLEEYKYNGVKDVPFMSLIPQRIKNNEWFDTAHQLLGACNPGVDFNEYTLADDHLNYKNIGAGDGFVKEGYGTLLAHYRKGVPVKLNTLVKEIQWDGKGVKVETNQGTIIAKVCVVTVSTGVLSSGKIKFKPALPLEKYEAFDGISLCTYNHITLKLREEFYTTFKIKPDVYFTPRIITKTPSPKGYCGTLRLHKSNLSYFDVGGQFAKDLEAEGAKASIDFVINSLRSTFGSEFDKYLIKAHATRWGQNQYTMGSYSSAKPGKAHLRKVLKSSVGDRIFFAGEATSINFATVHGADLSGKRVAKDVIKIARI